MKKNIVFFDSKAEGHHSEYLRHIARYASGSSELDQIHFVVPLVLSQYDPETVAVIRDHPRLHLHQLSTQELERIEGAPLWWRSFVEWKVAERYVRSLRADHCFFMEINIFQFVLGFLQKDGEVDISGILFFPYPRIEARSDALTDRIGCWVERVRKHYQLRWMLRNRDIGTVFLLNDEASTVYLNQFWPERRPFSMLPDPVPSLTGQMSNSQAHSWEEESSTSEGGDERADPPLEKTGRVRFLMFGALRQEKGVRNVIEAFGQLEAETAAQAKLCLFGEVQTELKVEFPDLVSSLRHVQPRLDVHVKDRFLPDEELEMALQAADVVLAPYLRTEGSSGVIGLSARYQSLVIGPVSGLVGSLIEKYDLGVTVNASDPTAIATAIRRYIRQCPDGKATAGMKSYVRERTPERFAKTIFSAVLNEEH